MSNGNRGVAVGETWTRFDDQHDASEQVLDRLPSSRAPPFTKPSQGAHSEEGAAAEFDSKIDSSLATSSNDNARQLHTRNMQWKGAAGRDKSPSTSSLFRLSRSSFRRKDSNVELSKNGDSNGGRQKTASFESQRSSASAESSSAGQARNGRYHSESSSPVLHRSALPFNPNRPSYSSSRGGSNSDVDGNRASSDLDSIVGQSSKPWLTLNHSSTSLISDSIAEDFEMIDPSEPYIPSSSNVRIDELQRAQGAYEAPSLRTASIEARATSMPDARVQPHRAVSTPSFIRRQGSEGVLQNKGAAKPPLHPTSSNRNLHGKSPVLPSPGLPPKSPLPPLPPGAAKIVSPRVRSQDRASGYFTTNAHSTEKEGMQEDTKLDSKNRSGVNDGELQGLGIGDTLNVPAADAPTKSLRKAKSQNSFRGIMRMSSFMAAGKPANVVKEDEGDRSDEVSGRRQDALSSSPSHARSRERRDSPEDVQRTVRKPKFSFRRPKTSDGGTLFGLSSSSSGRTSEASLRDVSNQQDTSPSQATSPLSISPVHDRLQPFLVKDSSLDSFSTYSQRQPSNGGFGTYMSRDNSRSTSTTTSGRASPTNISKLQTNGGAAGLFGNTPSTSRQRASSLLPSISWRQKGQSALSKATTSNGSLSAPLQMSTGQGEKERESGPKIDYEQFNGDAEHFVQHVLATVPRDDVAGVLASSTDDLHREALSLYMLRFYFAGNPLDIALRKLLMSLCLPKETQQIDRVMEAFAQRYNDCNEELFDNTDQPYVLAFSLMMLHTDAFNKNAKQKMSKQDYIRNTSSSGVRREILEYLYDNLTFTQFIYVDDDGVLSRRKSEGEASASGSILSALSSGTNSGSSSKNRIDPYYIIASGQTHTLRADIANAIAEDTPFSTIGTVGDMNVEELNRAFVNAPSIEIVTTKKPNLPSSAAAASLGQDALATTFGGADADREVIVTLRVTKIGCVSRKDDIVDQEKKAQSRRWKTTGMLLSSSQLLFFKDLVWTSALNQQIREQSAAHADREGGFVVSPRITYFKPDGVLALGDIVAVRDATYKKYKNVFRLVAKLGSSTRQYLIQAANEGEMNDWIHRINFCAAFRASGLRIRGLDPPVTPSVDGGSARSMTFPSPRSEDGAASFSSPPTSPGVQSEDGASATSVPLVGMMRRKLYARRKEVLPKLNVVKEKFAKCESELNSKLRFARHLGILTPFMKVTRDRIDLTAISLAARIKQLRLDYAKYDSRRQILLLELEAGDRAARATAAASSFDDSVDSGLGGPVDKPALRSSVSLDRLSVPTPSSSSAPESESSAKSSGSFKRSLVLDSLAEAENEVATPKLKTMNLEGLTSAESDSSLSRSAGNAGVPLRGLGLSDQHGAPDLDSQQQKETDENIHHIPHTNSNNSNNNNRGGHRWFKAVAGHHQSPREEAERWDRSRVARDSKRVSLVTLPDAEHLMDLSKISLLYASGASIPDEQED